MKIQKRQYNSIEPEQIPPPSPELNAQPSPQFNEIHSSLPPPLTESDFKRIGSTRLAVMVENEKLRRRNRSLEISIARLHAEVNHLRDTLNSTHRDLTRHRFYQIQMNSHFEMFLKDVSSLSDRYRHRTIEQVHEDAILISSDHTDSDDQE